MMGRKEMRAEVIQTKPTSTGTDLVGKTINMMMILKPTNLATVCGFFRQSKVIRCEGFLPSGDPLSVLKRVFDPYVPVKHNQDNAHHQPWC